MNLEDKLSKILIQGIYKNDCDIVSVSGEESYIMFDSTIDINKGTSVNDVLESFKRDVVPEVVGEIKKRGANSVMLFGPHLTPTVDENFQTNKIRVVIKMITGELIE
jgi:hypothetical protein